MKTRIFSSLFLPLFLTSLTLLTQSSALAQIPSTGLVGYWPFNGNANDESGNGNNGTVNGAALTTDRFGNANSAYSFDGVNDFIQTALIGPTGSNSRSVSYWVNSTSLQDNMTVLGYGNNNVASQDFHIWHNWNCPGMGINISMVAKTFSSQIQNSNWKHVVFVFDNTQGSSINNVLVYENGQLLTNVCSSFGVANMQTGNSFPICIGKYHASAQNYFNGKLDDISIYNRALTPAEINQLYTDQTSLVEVPCTPFLGEDQTVCAGTSVTLSASGSSLACPTLPSTLQNGLVGYWPFCGNANDASGNGNNGTVNGATLTTDRFGNANSAYSFDGVNDGINTTLQQNGILQYTISGWFKTTWGGVIVAGHGTQPGLTLHVHNDLSSIPESGRIMFAADGVSLQIGKYTNLTYKDDIWHHAIGVFSATPGALNPNQFAIYVDGNLVSQFGVSAYSSSAPINNNTNIRIGNHQLWPNGMGYFNGKIDDIAIYNRALSPSEIQQLYNLGQSTYLWSTGATTATINVTPTTTTTYTCTVTDANGNVCTDSVTVFVPQIEATDLTICAGETTTLSVSGINSTATPSACPTLPTNLQTGLVGYWPFCGNANDASGNGNNGTVNGATLTTDRFGNANSAYSFDGVNDFIQTAPWMSGIQNNYSISFWIRELNQSPSPAEKAVILHRGDMQDKDIYLLNGNTYFSDRNGVGIPATYGIVSSVINTWVNYVFVSTNSEFSIYANGVLLSTYARTNNSNWSANYLGSYFGGNGTDPNWHGSMNGDLDDILIYNRALSSAEVQESYSIYSATSYLWSNGATTPTINVSPTTTTTYTCTVTTNGVSCTDDITVVVSQPVASITPNGIVEICQGQSIALTANGGVSYLWSTGAPTQSITVNTEAVYTVSVTDANGCTDTESQLVKVNFLPNIGVNNASICPGQSTTLTATGGLSYVWSPATGLSSTTGTTVTASPSTSTAYTVTGTGANGCTNTATAAVAVNVAPTATITPATATTFCQGGSVVLNANTGTGVTYQWRLNGTNITGATSSSYTANASGSYTVIVTNTSTCSATSTATVVTVNALPTATITPATATTFCQGGSVVLNANAGTGLTYQWRLNGTNVTGATSSSYTANASGSYTVVVTNTSTCSATSTATVVTVNALPTATITPATATTFCQGGSVVLNANTGTGLSYQWRLNGTNITGATTSSYTANASGSYTVVVTNTSTCSATSTATVVTVNALPTATITASSATTFCQGGSVVLTANTGTGLSYQWYNNAAIISGATTSSYTANASGSYTVVVTNASTCSATSTATVVTVNALPTATITAATATTFCQGGSVVLNANTGTGLSYQWRLNGTNITGATTSNYTANASGSYTVVVTNTSTCSATSTATAVTVNALPTATITPATTTTFCQGGSVVLNANTGTGLSYQWRLNGTNITGATTSSYTANASGSYTVVVTNTSTCSATSAATVVTVNGLPSATITASSATTFCQGVSVVLNANTGTGLTYQWRLNGTNITGATSSSYTANASGSYTVVVTNTSTCSATSTATVVTVNALPTSTITPATATTFCQGGSVVLNANTGAGLSYQWFNNAVVISGATSSSYTANASGSYTVVVTNTSTCSATSTATVVTVNALPTATITPATVTTFCQGGSVVLNANTGTGLTYQWKLNGTNITGATTSSYTANASGSYTVVVTNTSACSATSTAAVVTVNALPTATITPATSTTFCQGGNVVLNANTGTGLSYQWRLNGTNITGATSSSYTANASGFYTVVVTNTSTCSATSTATVVTVNALPTATITPATATTFCQGGSVVLNANTGTGLTYQWKLNGTNITGATTSSYTANASGSYTVVVTNTSTCSATSTATVVTVNALPTATISASSATTFCQGGSVVLTANTGAGLSYQWFNNAVAISGATTSTYTANASGSYTVVVTNTSTCSATSTAIDVTAVPNLDYFADADGDGFGDVTTLISTCVQPQGYVTDNTDCKDNDAAIFPGAQEICNDVDDDCNDLIDDGLVFITYYADADGDSFGDINNPLDACLIPDGYVTNSADCNDNNTNQNSSSAEICNGEDDDCDGTIDNGLIFLDYYADLDSDGFGAGAATNSCVDLGAGYVTNNTDCNNANALINPNATEICNSIDDNCDGQIDEGITFTTYYQDFDNDGFGTGTAVTSCTNPGAGWVTTNTDCDDTNGNTFPGATEVCNTIDDNCDGQTDEGVQTVYFIDNDGDTYGNPSVSILSCTQPIGYTPDDTDCNDINANINPGAEDIAGNGIDENCDGQIDNSIFELNASISLYPNPTRSELNIQVNSNIIGNDLYIFDAVGKLVFKQQLLSTQTILPVSNFADGNYFVRVGEVVKRFEVMK